MKKLFTLIAAVLVTASVFAQSPEKMSYQAVIRNADQSLVVNSPVGMQISILKTSADGVAVYTETQIPTTNANGLVSLEIGMGDSSDDFSTIDWASGIYFIKTETDPTGGINYTITGVSQLLSVPYALHAKTAETISGTINVTESDPTYTASQAVKITAGDITNLSTLSGINTGDQDLSGLLTTETDPEFSNSKAAQITNSGSGIVMSQQERYKLSRIDARAEVNVRSDWKASSGDAHIINKPILFTTADESDPVYSGSEASNITAGDITNLGNLSNTNSGDQDLSALATKTALGDSTALVRSEIPDVSGFLSAETDPIFTGSQAVNIIAGDITNLSNLSNTNTGDQDLSALVTKTALGDSTALVRSEIPDVSGFLSSETQTISDVAALNNSVNTQMKNVTNPTDAQDAATKAYVDQLFQVFENNGLIVVDFAADDAIHAVGENVSFTDNSAINPNVWAWDFGDGNTATTQNPIHAYASAGLYTVSLTASNGTLSKTESKTDYITAFVPEAGVTDIDGNSYNTIIIGTQEWMVENLKTTKYNDGTPIPLVTNKSSWYNLTTPGYCWYDNDSVTYAQTYGALYNWYTIENGNLCPTGWHIPTDAEWIILTDYLGGAAVAGDKLKDIGDTYWNTPNTGATNETGFTALPGGRRNSSGDFSGIGQSGSWWSAFVGSTKSGRRYSMSYSGNAVYIDYLKTIYGCSIRCVRD